MSSRSKIPHQKTVYFHGTNQNLPVSLLSTVYPVIGLPPSVVGGVQETVMESARMSDTSGTLGGPGTSADKIHIN